MLLITTVVKKTGQDEKIYKEQAIFYKLIDIAHFH